MYFTSYDNEEIQISPEVTQQLEIQVLSDRRFHILNEGKSIIAEVVEADFKTKEFTIKINQNNYQLVVEDQFDRLIKDLGLSKVQNSQVKEIKAPMPGLVLDIVVQVGATVVKGDALVILEAMKMENIIKSPGDGIIKSIKVDQGQSVDKNQILVDFE